jgi:DNA-binding transcriptional regulator YiaG
MPLLLKPNTRNCVGIIVKTEEVRFVHLFYASSFFSMPLKDVRNQSLGMSRNEPSASTTLEKVHAAQAAVDGCPGNPFQDIALKEVVAWTNPELVQDVIAKREDEKRNEQARQFRKEEKQAAKELERGPVKPTTTFCQTLSAGRNAKGLTQPQLAQGLHVTLATLKSWERGEKTPSGPMIAKINQQLGIVLPK